MNSPFRRLSALFLCGAAFLLGANGTKGQIAVNGLADKTIYNDSVTFSVPAQAGYNYRILLDTNVLSTDVSNTVTRVEYHELQVVRTNLATSDVTNRLVRFIVRSSERGNTEDGILPWTPYPLINSSSNEFAGAHLRMITPQDFPTSYEVPVVAWVENDQGHAIRANGQLTATGQPSIQLRRGVGSGFLAATNPAGRLAYPANVRQLQASNVVNLESNTVWTPTGGTLSGATTWPVNSRIAVTNNLSLLAAATLTIGEGTVVRLNPGVNFNVSGHLTITGTTNRPVIFMPVSRAQPWGGFLLTSNTSQLSATGTIFTGSGAVTNWFGTGGRPGSHRPEQALFYCTNSPILTLVDCAAIYLSGQLSHAANGGTFNYTRFLMQHTTTGGEHTGASFNVNDGAFIECPDDTTDFVDGDNDALYLVNGTHGFTNTLFGWTKDDGVDSGGSGGGLLNFQNCWFESTFHEGNSLSGTGKVINHFNSVFINCGQGLEDGYDSPTGTMNHCLSTANVIGARFGDNYANSYAGFLRATNSLILYNHRDVWGMEWKSWTYRTNAMDVRSNFLSVADAYHPSNTLWQAGPDGGRLGSFMSVPGADVGIGIASGQTLFDMTAITNGLPVRLSCFTTNSVSIDYIAELPGQPTLSGSLQFLPGETVKVIPLTMPAPGSELGRVRIYNPVHAEVTGPDTTFFMRPTTNATVRLGRFGSDVLLFWEGSQGTLQQADSVTGPWTDVPATVPYQPNLNGTAGFYRLRLP